MDPNGPYVMKNISVSTPSLLKVQNREMRLLHVLQVLIINTCRTWSNLSFSATTQQPLT